MHRSGTSFLARALNLSGVYLGELDSLLSHEWKFYKDNPRGHWENKKIYGLAEKTFESNKGSWHKIPKKIVVNKRLGKEIKKCTTQLQNNSTLAAGFKDPRILLCFDSWKKFLPKNFVIIGIIRHPLKVAESLKKRDNFSYEKSLKLWEIYNQNLLSLLDKHDGFLLDFDWPKSKLLSEIKLISKKLGLAQNIDLSDWYTKDLFKSDKTYKSNYVLSKDIELLYSKLKKRTKQNKFYQSKKNSINSIDTISVASKLLAQIRNQEKYFGTGVKYDTNLEEKLQKLQKQFDERSKWAISLDAELNTKSMEIADLQQQYDEYIKTKSNELGKLQKQYDERSKWATSLDAKLKTKSKEIRNLQKLYDERSKWATSLDAKLKTKSKDIDNLQKLYDERSKWAASLDAKLKTKSKEIRNLQKLYDERSKWVTSLDAKLKTKSKDLDNLQKQFDERSKWATSLDTDLKTKSNELTDLQKQFDERSKWATSLDTELNIKSKELGNLQNSIRTKDSQIQNLQEVLNKTLQELEEIKSSVIYGILKGTVSKLDKIAPPSTRRKNALKLAGAAYLIKRDHGTKALLNATKTKFQTKKTTKQYLPKNLLKSILKQFNKKKLNFM